MRRARRLRASPRARRNDHARCRHRGRFDTPPHHRDVTRARPMPRRSVAPSRPRRRARARMRRHGGAASSPPWRTGETDANAAPFPAATGAPRSCLRSAPAFARRSIASRAALRRHHCQNSDAIVACVARSSCSILGRRRCIAACSAPAAARRVDRRVVSGAPRARRAASPGDAHAAVLHRMIVRAPKRKPAAQGGRFGCRDEAARLSGRLPRAARRSRPGTAVRSTAPGRRSPARTASLRRRRPR